MAKQNFSAKLPNVMNENYSDKTTNQRILMIDDDVKLCRLVRDYLAPFGFSVTSANNGREGLARVKNENFDVLILDVMLPEIDGFTLLKQIREISSIPILMLTALGDEADRIIGLESGADDYLPKTFSTRELLARLRAITRRVEIEKAQHKKNLSEEITVKGIYLNSATREAKFNGELLVLTTLEFDLLFCLARAAGRVLNRDTLLDEIAGRNYDVFDRSIDVHISSLRRKLADDSKNPQYIKTIRSVGYMLAAEET